MLTVLPGVSGACLKKGVNLRLELFGKNISLPPALLQAFAAVKHVHGNAASRVELMRVLRPLIESGQVSREVIGELIEKEVLWVDKDASREFLRGQLKINNPNIKAHHDLPLDQDLQPLFLKAGLDPNDPEFGRPVHHTTHSDWHDQKLIPRGGPFNQVWRDFFRDKPEATAQEILSLFSRIRSGEIFELEIRNGDMRKFRFK